jgi:argininosuccinate synthase
MGRVITSQIAVKVAGEENCNCIAHGCTGKGNDQVRFESYILTLNPGIKIIAPVREWNMDRDEEIQYALDNNIPVPVRKDFPYSVDDNMWGMTWEGGEIENPALIPPVDKFLTTYTLPKNAPDESEYVKIKFEKGTPVELNGEKLKLADLISKLNKIAGKHGIGVVHMYEDRLVGLKDRGVYELPAGHVIIEAHKKLEMGVLTRTANELKQTLDVKWAYLCYASLWFDPAMKALNSFNKAINENATGIVTVELFKGKCNVVAVDSPNFLGHASFNNSEGYKFNTNASAGFIEIYSLQMKMANNLKLLNKNK